jgi:hypothetical protein
MSSITRDHGDFGSRAAQQIVASHNVVACGSFSDYPLRISLCLRASVVGFSFPITRDHGDSCSPLPVSLSHDPTPHRRFVENKSSTPIRQSFRPSGRSLFSCFSAVQFGAISALFFRFCCSVGRGSQLVKAARRKTGAPDEPGFGLAGWNFAAPQTVIVPCRWPKARALSAVEGDRRSREPNDLKSGSERADCCLLIAIFQRSLDAIVPNLCIVSCFVRQCNGAFFLAEASGCF